MRGLPFLLLLPFFANGSFQELKIAPDLYRRISQLEERSQRLEEKVATQDGLEEKVKKMDDLEEKVAKLDDLEEKVTKLDDLEERVTKLEELTKVSTLRSCREYAEFGLSPAATGLYLIDPDGPLIGQPPIQVLCNFTSGSTEVLHDATSLTDVEHCHDPGCYEKEVTYINGATNEPIPLSQIDSLIQISDFCEQRILYECTLAPLRVEGKDFAFWTDRHGEENVYFTGANKGFHSCDCQFTEEGCFEHESRGNTCNCDANIPAPLVDTGTITNTTALPVMKLSFGGLTYDIQTGAYQLGNLRCFGKKEVEVASSCSALKMKGTMKSGYYDIKKPGDVFTSIVFCDMTENGYDIPEIDQYDHSSPLGTIAAWVSKPTVDSTAEQTINEGWVSCNGSLIERGPWAGGRTPNLNSGQFLRGGELGQQLETEEDQLEDHQHEDPGHTHSASSSSSPHTHGYKDRNMYGNTNYAYKCYEQKTCHSQYDDTIQYQDTNTESASASVSTTVSSQTTGISGVSSSSRKGAETRPKNTKITWIMKCW